MGEPGRGPGGPRARAAQALIRATGALSTSAITSMDADLPWFGELSAEERSWVGVIVGSGIRDFVEWFAEEEIRPGRRPDSEVAASVFGAAPRALAGAISLQQTVDLVRLSISVVERQLDAVVAAADVDLVRGAVLRYAREVAFATAEVYARAAEARGAWDARLEALVVDAVLRAEPDEAVLSRAGALGWAGKGRVAVVLGPLPARRAESDVFAELRRAAASQGLDALCATQGERVVVLLGGVDDARTAAESLLAQLGEGPVVVGPVAPDLARAHLSARVAAAAHRAVDGWAGAPRPVLADELLAERALAGDGHARRELVEELYLPLAEHPVLVESLTVWFDQGGSIEATARALFVHANTVRYRLRQIADLTGFTPGRPRDAFALRVALVLGRQSGRRPDRPDNGPPAGSPATSPSL